MIQDYNKFEIYSSKKIIEMENDNFNDLVNKFSFRFINTDVIDLQLIEKFKNSKIKIIDNYPKEFAKYFILCFSSELVIIHSSNLSLLIKLFEKNNIWFSFFINNSKENLQNILHIPVFEEKNDKKIFDEEISNFNQVFQIKKPSLPNFWKIIQSCLSGYLIKEGYFKVEFMRDREYNFISKFERPKITTFTNKGEFVMLRYLGSGSYSKAFLNYHIKNQQLLVIKEQYITNQKLQKREIENFENIYSPYSPCYYGFTDFKDGNQKKLVVEFITGKSFNEINEFKFNSIEKLFTIINLIYIIKFFHSNNFILRDLKPDNIILTKNDEIVLIDFDRLIVINDHCEKYNIEYSNYLSHIFAAPELSNENCIPSNKCDIYSFGIMMYSILMDHVPKNEKEINLNYFEYLYPIMFKLYLRCINTDPDQRFSIFEIINYIKDNSMNLLPMQHNRAIQHYISDKEYINEMCILYFRSLEKNDSIAQMNLSLKYLQNKDKSQADIDTGIYFLTLSAENKNYKAQNYLGNFFWEGKYVHIDINKALHYWTLSANQNYENAQFNLGAIYYEGKNIKRNIRKAIHYLTLSADQNNSEAQEYLSRVYLNNNFMEYDINKGIYYLTLAANHNNAIAQNNLGAMYLEGMNVSKDLDKAIYYLEKAANQKNLSAINNLGMAYLRRNANDNDIEKAIYYFEIAAKQNVAKAQNNLGTIYSTKEYNQFDINKGIYYLSLAADQNDPQAQNNLGEIYLLGSHANINKAMHYLNLASSQNYSRSQFALGFIYFSGKHINQDIDKSIYYLTLASNNNDIRAHNILGKIYYEIKNDVNKAFYYFMLSSKMNDPYAQYMIGLIFYEKRDINKAIFYLTLSADQNELFSQQLLGTIYYNNDVIPRDINKAIHYFSLASNQNDANSQYNLGLIYYEGIYIKQDVNKAIYYLTKSAKQDFTDSQYLLSIIFYTGYYIPRDIKKTIYYL